MFGLDLHTQYGKNNIFSRLFLSQTVFLFLNVLILVNFLNQNNMQNLETNATRNSKKSTNKLTDYCQK